MGSLRFQASTEVKNGGKKWDVWTDLILNSTAARQLVAVADGDYNGGLKEEGIPPLQRGTSEREKTFVNIYEEPTAE